MKKLLSLLSFILILSSVDAQITINRNTFPVAGDTLFSGVDNMPVHSLIQVTPAGNNQTWDFASLQAPLTQEAAVKLANEGENIAFFPDADLVLEIEGGEAYLKTTSDKMEILGIAGTNQLELGLDLIAFYTDPALYRKAPIQYNDQYNDQQSLRLSVDSDDLPFLDTLELPITLDSLRITINTSIKYHADAWGNMTLPAKSYDVLRIKREEIRNAKIEAKTPFVGWIDVTNLIPEDIDIAPQADTSLFYDFYSDNAIEPIAILSVFNDTVRTVTFKTDTRLTTSSINIKDYNRLMVAYPNPAIDKVRFDLKGFQTGDYTLRFYNIVGKVAYEHPIKIGRNSTVRISLGHLFKGTYLYSLIDNSGRSLVTKRLVIMKP